MRLRVSAKPQSDDSSHAVLIRDDPDGRMQHASDCEFGLVVPRPEVDIGPAKLLNAGVFTVIAFQCGNRRALVHVDTASPLQVVDRNAAECLKVAVQRLRMASPEAEKFKRKIRLR